MAVGRHRALLIGNSTFPRDTTLPSLHGPPNDVPAIAAALTDAETGLFGAADVRQLIDQETLRIKEELEVFFGDASRDDVVLLYYSGHGLDTIRGGLLLCGRDTRTDRKLATTISAEFISSMIDSCASQTALIVLDCCHSGRFKSGVLADPFHGTGRHLLASSRPAEKARDADTAGDVSPFTAQLINGLLTAPAPANSDHLSLADLYRFIFRARQAGDPVPHHRFDGTGDIPIARRFGRAATVPEVDGPRLLLSDRYIDLGIVTNAHELPGRRIDVHGAVGRWTAWSVADWVIVDQRPDHAVLEFRPTAPGPHRAFVHFRDPDLGELTTLVLVVEVRPRPSMLVPEPGSSEPGPPEREPPLPVPRRFPPEQPTPTHPPQLELPARLTTGTADLLALVPNPTSSTTEPDVRSDAEIKLDAREARARDKASAGQYTEAAQLLSDIIINRRRICGAEDPRTLASRHMHAAYAGKAGHCAEAVRLLRPLVDDYTRVLGPNHPDTLTSRRSLARYIGQGGDHAEAARLLRLLVDDCNRVLGPNHPTTLANHRSLARYLGVGDAHAEAVRQPVDDFAWRPRTATASPATRNMVIGIIIRLCFSALAMSISTFVVSGIALGGDSLPATVGTTFAVAIIFGIVNAVLRPIIKTVGCVFYVVTLGLVAIVVNALLFMLTSWIAGQLDLPFQVANFWPSVVLGALLVGIISWVLNLVVPDGKG